MGLRGVFALSLLLVSLPALFAWKNEPNCGIKGAEFARIIDGVDAARFEFPWQIKDYGKGCGGSIINRRWIMSAAHCLNHFKPNEVRMFAGVYNLSKENDPYKIELEAEKVFIHEKYKYSTLNYDMALVKLKKDLPLDDPSKHIGAVCLPEADQDLDRLEGHTALTTGWGDTYEIKNGEIVNRNQSKYADVLQKINITVWKQEDCATAMLNAPKSDTPESDKDIKVTPMMICANDYEKAGCYGDSGGPMVVYEHGRWYQYGVTSWGPLGCAYPQYPTVFSRVTSFLDWIDHIVSTH